MFFFCVNAKMFFFSPWIIQSNLFDAKYRWRVWTVKFLWSHSSKRSRQGTFLTSILERFITVDTEDWRHCLYFLTNHVEDLKKQPSSLSHSDAQRCVSATPENDTTAAGPFLYLYICKYIPKSKTALVIYLFKPFLSKD